MNTWRWLTGPDAGFYLPGVFTGLAIALMCALLSPLVVLKRMSFIGQGISHAALGGIGLAVALLALGLIPAAWFGVAQLPIVLLFCLACAFLIARLTERSALHADTAIGIVLVGSMTLGALLIARASRQGGTLQARSWESILFGSILAVGEGDAVLAWIVALAILAALWWFRRPLLFWAFDEPAAPAFGVPAGAMKNILVLLLAAAIVTSMKLAGVVLATALLVLPGAIAMALSDRLVPVFLLSVAAGLAGVLGGLVLSFETEDLPPGACIVAVLVGLFIVARAAAAARSRRTVAGSTP